MALRGALLFVLGVDLFDFVLLVVRDYDVLQPYGPWLDLTRAFALGMVVGGIFVDFLASSRASSRASSAPSSDDFA